MKYVEKPCIKSQGKERKILEFCHGHGSVVGKEFKKKKVDSVCLWALCVNKIVTLFLSFGTEKRMASRKGVPTIEFKKSSPAE